MSSKSGEVSDAAWKRFNEGYGSLVLNETTGWQNLLFNETDHSIAHRGYCGYELSEEGSPVFYKQIQLANGNWDTILTLAMQGREVYEKTPYSFARGYEPCEMQDRKKKNREQREEMMSARKIAPMIRNTFHHFLGLLLGVL